MVWRHPFPGQACDPHHWPGHGGTPRDPSRNADASCSRSCARPASTATLAVLRGAPGIRSVGVQGDERTYAYLIVIRAGHLEDAMTADWARLPHELLDTIASRIVNEVPRRESRRLDLSSKPPATISGNEGVGQAQPRLPDQTFWARRGSSAPRPALRRPDGDLDDARGIDLDADLRAHARRCRLRRRRTRARCRRCVAGGPARPLRRDRRL